MMEKYADNLEELVMERTGQLIEEKKKTDALLERMLPRQVGVYCYVLPSLCAVRYGDAMRLYIVCPIIYGYKSHVLDSRDYFLL